MYNVLCIGSLYCMYVCVNIVISDGIMVLVVVK